MGTFAPISGTRVIGLTGHARHGKDSAAKILMRLLPGAERFAFSDALAVECRVHHGMTARDPRILQDVGMQFRESHAGVWLRCLYGAIADRQPETAIVTGVRFPDEAAMIRSMGGEMLRVIRLDDDGREFVSGDRDAAHKAEAEINRIDVDVIVRAKSNDLAGLETLIKSWLSSREVAA